MKGEKGGEGAWTGKAAWWVGWGEGQGTGGVGQCMGSNNKTERMVP